jgi:hypothetical protein
MWKLYVHGREGVAIKTTVGLLGRLVSEDNRALRTGLVEYRDVDKTPQGRSRVLHFEGTFPARQTYSARMKVFGMNWK